MVNGLPELHIVAIIILCMMLSAVIEFIRSFSAKEVFAGFRSCLPWYG
ncbi:C4-dicarboxylate transporter DcuC [Proteus mirabilis]|uniref:C4-dicarboxylate transporter DcuC n=1 Tax=Proteus mirabilis TaxID=584 RepID=A0A2X2C5M9_PROMI|nr:C4-dicarboxylate transporter DcuC [Proteus mirabilis]